MSDRQSWRSKFAVLEVYNSEVARGLVHHPLWQAKMRRLQEAYDQKLADLKLVQTEPPK